MVVTYAGCVRGANEHFLIQGVAPLNCIVTDDNVVKVNSFFI